MKFKVTNQAGHVCHEFESDDVQAMADYMLASYAFGADSADRRDDDYAQVYSSLADFESVNFADDDGKDYQLKTYVGETPYSELPAGSNLLYIASNHGWELIPISNPRQIIDELNSFCWDDALTQEFYD